MGKGKLLLNTQCQRGAALAGTRSDTARTRYVPKGLRMFQPFVCSKSKYLATHLILCLLSSTLLQLKNLIFLLFFENILFEL